VRGVPLTALGWFVLSVGPAWLMMRPAWLQDAPRFLYPAAVGAALWWGAALGWLAGRRWWWQAPVTLGLAAAMAPGIYFAGQGLAWHLRGGGAIWDAVHAAEHYDDPLLLVNLPDRLAPFERLYPYQHGGAILLPPQVPVAEITGAHLGADRPDDVAVTVGYALPPASYERTTYGALTEGQALADLIDAGRRVYVADYSDPIRLAYAGRVLDRPPRGDPLAVFDDRLILRSATLDIESDRLTLTLIWELSSRLDGAPTMFVHIADASGAIVVQADGHALLNLHPLGLWSAGAVIEDVRYATLPGGGPYSVYVGVWRPAVDVRLEARSPTGEPYPENRVPVGVAP
jgi:hypothetical protein